jgi:hypothetical protein
MKHLSFIIVLLFAFMALYSCNFTGKSDNQSSEETAATSENATSNQEESATNQATKAEEEAPVAQVNKKKPEKPENGSEPFDYLEKLSVFETDYMTIEVKYNTSVSEVFNQTVSELPKDDPFHYSEDGPSMDNVKVLKTKIAPSGPYYYVIFSAGPSADPSFIFYKEGSYDQSALYIMALKVYIPGNGNIYAEGHTNNTFNKRRKFTLSNGKFVEVEQPYYYVGLKTQTLKPVKLYKSKNLSQVIANLPANYSIEVLINDPENSSTFLVKTDFGLTGWLKIPGENMFGGNEMIKGIFMAGD